MRFLKNIFGQRLISKGIWPPRSSDLSPPDFYLWAAKKARVYKHCPKTLDDLCDSITDYIQHIPRYTLQRVFDNMMRPIDLCVEAEGHHF